jgi:pyridoxal phosphate enzyme (YggS family)
VTTSSPSIAERLAAVQQEVAAAARAAGREPATVRIIAASKYADVEAIRAAARAGQRDFGENYVQNAERKIHALAGEDVRWHFIGALQSNKAAKAAGLFDLIHTLSSASALQAISRALPQGVSRRVLVQVHLGGGSQRAGLDPAAVPEFVRAAAAARGVVVDGLMGVAPANEPARPHFARLRALLDELRELGLPHAPLREMSAGMSEDFADAICEGATMVRIGRSLFGR